jgi:hypothetical protein
MLGASPHARLRLAVMIAWSVVLVIGTASLFGAPGSPDAWARST